MEDSSDDNDLPITPVSHKKRQLASSDESDDDTGHKQSTRKSARSSERIRVKSQRQFRMPSRKDVFNAIPALQSPDKGISQLKPRKLVNNFTRVRHRYNYDPDFTDSEESLSDFIVEDDYEEEKPSTKAKPKKGGRVKNKPLRTHRIQAPPTSSSDSEPEPLQTLSQSITEPSKLHSAKPAASAVASEKASAGVVEEGGGGRNSAAASSQDSGWKGRLRVQKAKDNDKPTPQRKGRAKSAPLKSSPVDVAKKSKESHVSSEDESDADIGRRKVKRHTELDSESSDSESSGSESSGSDSEGEAREKPAEPQPGENGDNHDSEPEKVSSGASSEIEEFSSSEEGKVEVNSAGHPVRKVVVVRSFEKSHKFDQLKNLRKEREKRLSTTEKKKEK